MKKILLTFLVISVVFATQYVGIPKREPGILIGNTDAEVKIDLIYDPVCDGSAYFEGIFQQAWISLTPELRDRISVRYLSLSLPYHITAQKLTQAIVYVQQQKGNQEAATLLRDFLTNLEQNDEANIQSQTINGLLTRTAKRVNTLFGLKTEDVLKELAHGSATDRAVRQWSKFAMGSVRASGTPTMRINGVKVEGAVGLTVQQLTDLINSLFNNTA